MMNKKGLGKFESITMLVLIIGLLAFFMYQILGLNGGKNYSVMVSDATTFAKTVSNDSDLFNQSRYYYLSQAIEDGLMKSIQNPVGSGTCDEDTSYVHYDESHYYVTFVCGNYIIDNQDYSDHSIKVYELGKWKNTKSSDEDEEGILYSCSNCGVDGELLELDFIKAYNKVTGNSYSSVSEISKINPLTVHKKYRTKNLVYES